MNDEIVKLFNLVSNLLVFLVLNLIFPLEALECPILFGSEVVEVLRRRRKISWAWVFGFLR